MITTEYLFVFILGGLFSALIKYMSNNLSAEVGAIVATVPISLFSAYFIIHDDKIHTYIREYLEQTLFIVLMTVLYLYLLHNNTLQHKTIYVIIITLWILFAGYQVIF